MRFLKLPRVLAAVVVIVSGVGYVVFVKSSNIDRTHLASLVIQCTGVKTLKAKSVESQLVTASKSGFSEMKKAAATDPTETGGYGKVWSGSTASGDVVTELIVFLPTTSEAKLVRAEAVAEYSNTKDLKAAHTTLTSRFTLPSASGAFGARFVTAKSSTTGAGSSTAIVFQFNRAVAVEYAESTTGGLTQANAITIAKAEHTLLEQREPGFSIVQTIRPLELSVIYGLVSLVAIALVLVVPGWIRRRRLRRVARRDEQARYEYRARGGKQMRRRRPPAWAQRAR
jgi:hypothetical protein